MVGGCECLYCYGKEDPRIPSIWRPHSHEPTFVCEDENCSLIDLFVLVMDSTHSWMWPLLAILIVAGWKLSRIGRRPEGFPPGPPTLPLIGNLHQIPQKRSHEQFKKWAEEYGLVLTEKETRFSSVV